MLDLKSMINNYYLLDGQSLQWAIPEKTIMYIHKMFNCNTELFASPLNVRLSNYYSLFKRDELFGSLGNFFNSPDSQFMKGSFEVNPPFIDIIFTRVVNRIIHLLELAFNNKSQLLFIFIIPSWFSCDAYKNLNSTHFTLMHLNFQKYNHSYYQYSSKQTFKAPFDTNLFILSSYYIFLDNNFESKLRYLWN